MSKKTPDIESIADLALGEIGKRFEERPQDIPDHVLAKYFTDVNKVIDRRSEKEAEEESKPFNLRDELDTLPLKHGMALVADEIQRLSEELGFYEAWYEKATNSNGTQDVEAAGVGGPQEAGPPAGAA